MMPSRKERVRQAYLGNGLNIGEVHAYAEKVMEDRLHDDARREITTEAVLKKDAKVYGVIKSTVLIKAISSDRRQTAASSQVSKPTNRLGSCEGCSALSASDRTVGPIFAAQPQVRESPVDVFFFLKRDIMRLRIHVLQECLSPDL